MGENVLEKKLKEIKIRIDQLADCDVRIFVEKYPLLKKYYAKLNSIKGDCKKCGFCCIGGTMLSEGEINALRTFIPEIDDFVRIRISRNLVTGETFRYTAIKCSKYGYCIFNATDGPCIIHKIRPISCRVIPFHLKRKGTCAKNVTFTGDLSLEEGNDIWEAHFLEVKKPTNKLSKQIPSAIYST